MVEHRDPTGLWLATPPWAKIRPPLKRLPVMHR